MEDVGVEEREGGIATNVGVQLVNKYLEETGKIKQCSFVLIERLTR